MDDVTPERVRELAPTLAQFADMAELLDGGSLDASRAHNPASAGSTPAPATTEPTLFDDLPLVNRCGHPTRDYYARGMCVICYAEYLGRVQQVCHVETCLAKAPCPVHERFPA